MRRSPRETLRNLATLVIGILVAVVIAEGALRLIKGSSQVTKSRFGQIPHVTHEGTFIPWTLEPGRVDRHIDPYGEFNTEFRINSLGLRDNEMPRAKPQGTFRILMLGDSMTVGWGVEAEETFSSRLEALLNETSQEASGADGLVPCEGVQGGAGESAARHYQTLNCGWASWYTTDGAYVFLKHRLGELDGDLVVLNMFLNDPAELTPEWWRPPAPSLPDSLVAPRVADGPVHQRPGLVSRFRGFLDHHSYIYNIVRQRWAGVARRLAGGEDLFTMAAVFGNEYPANAVILFAEDYPPGFRRRMELTEILLVGMRDLCAEKGSCFAVSIVPAGFQVIDRKRERYGILPVIFHDQRYIKAKAQKQIVEMCERNGIP
ncbi:MAG: hypothetical protein JXA57_16120, partial [Armatimonadetes bacterium]|nr:hypothetical protein [Armatimonadota bacterium]